jgi:alkylation response protein AidB-like acyl-CoA dehydrogenase
MSIRLLARGHLDPRLGAGLAPTRPAVRARLDEVRAAARTIDPVETERARRLPEAAVADLFDAGLFTLTVPEAHGGAGATLVEFTRAAALAAEHDAALAVTAVPHLANGVLSLALFGDAAQREEVLGGITRRRSLVAFALTEAHTGSDVASHRSRLSPASGGLRLDGSKTWITNVARAGHVVVVAKCPELSPVRDGSAFVLVRPGARGLEVGKAWHKLAVNASPTVDLFFDGVELPAERVIGRMGHAMAQFGEVVIWGRLGAAAGACGLLARVAGWAAAAAERSPAAARLEAALARRALLARATLEVTAARCAADAGDRETAAALCKLFCTRSAEQAARAAWAFALERLGSSCPPLLAQSVHEAAVFKVLEGPDELLAHRAAVDVVGGLRSPWTGALPGAGAGGAAARLARAFAGWLAPLATSAGPLADAPVQRVADHASAAWAGACGAAWAAQPALPAEERLRARDATEAFCEAASRALHGSSNGGAAGAAEERN